jgi:5-formyltetrahydrofolate cyclo-ligase
MSSALSLKQHTRQELLSFLKVRGHKGSDLIVESLKGLLPKILKEASSSSFLGGFYPLSTEPQIQNLFENSFETRGWCFPKVEALATRLFYYQSYFFKKSSLFGVLEPVMSAAVNPSGCMKELQEDLLRKHLEQYLEKQPGKPLDKELKEILLSDLSVVLIPGLGFDKRGYRLGRGQGFFDRTLKGLSALKVGIAYEDQVLDTIVYDSWDEPMDLLVTDANIYDFRKVK